MTSNKKKLYCNKNLQNPISKGFQSGSQNDKEFCLEYAESLAEGDIRPIVIENYVEE